MYRIYQTLFCAFVLIGCSTQPSKLEKALELSGENRHELEYVLSHYSQSTSDSLQLKAAIFLIENMPGHHMLTNKSITRYINTMDSLYPDMSNVMKKAVYNIPLKNLNRHGKLKKIEDIEVIKGNYLIQHIDNSIQMWNKCFWLRQLSFEDFCEYILPYRTAYEPLLQSDSTLYSWKTVLESFKYYHYVPTSISDVKSIQRNLLGHSDDMYFRGIKIPTLSDSNYKFDCLDVCYYELSRLRTTGIPAAIDFIPGWSYRNGQHYWRVTIDPIYANDNSRDMQNPKTAKVYRMSYSHNPIPVSDGKDSIPPLFQNPFIKDVTQQYIKVSDIEVEWKKSSDSTPLYLYLSVFNDLAWKPIAWSAVKENKASFQNMGRDIVYLPTYYNGGCIINNGFPFLLDINGKVRNLIPDKKHPIHLKITRKYPLNDYKMDWAESLKGCYIEASDHPDFKNADTIYTITRTNPDLNYDTIILKQPASYRYWRICKPNQIIMLGDWQFFDSNLKQIKGKAMDSNENDRSVFNAFDNDILTFSASASWLGIDLGERAEIKMMKYIPRTDGNGITSGHEYELSFYDEEGWKTISTQQATGESIEFNSVPSDALFWLKDNTDGKEERIFTYENGQVIFW